MSDTKKETRVEKLRSERTTLANLEVFMCNALSDFRERFSFAVHPRKRESCLPLHPLKGGSPE